MAEEEDDDEAVTHSLDPSSGEVALDVSRGVRGGLSRLSDILWVYVFPLESVDPREPRQAECLVLRRISPACLGL